MLSSVPLVYLPAMRLETVPRAGFEPAPPTYGIGNTVDHLSIHPHTRLPVVPDKTRTGKHLA